MSDQGNQLFDVSAMGYGKCSPWVMCSSSVVQVSMCWKGNQIRDRVLLRNNSITEKFLTSN